MNEHTEDETRAHVQKSLDDQVDRGIARIAAELRDLADTVERRGRQRQDKIDAAEAILSDIHSALPNLPIVPLLTAARIAENHRGGTS